MSKNIFSSPQRNHRLIIPVIISVAISLAWTLVATFLTMLNPDPRVFSELFIRMIVCAYLIACYCQVYKNIQNEKYPQNNVHFQPGTYPNVPFQPANNPYVPPQQPGVYPNIQKQPPPYAYATNAQYQPPPNVQFESEKKAPL